MKENNMGTITTEQAEKLTKSGVITDEVKTTLEKDGLISTRRSSKSWKMKTADGSWVFPTLYYRGGKGTTMSKKQISFNTEFNTLCEKYGTSSK
jgi:hypothetical protein